MGAFCFRYLFAASTGGATHTRQPAKAPPDGRASRNCWVRLCRAAFSTWLCRSSFSPASPAPDRRTGGRGVYPLVYCVRPMRFPLSSRSDYMICTKGIRPIRVFVHLAHGFGAESWQARWSRGEIIGINERLPYGYFRAREDGCTVE